LDLAKILGVGDAFEMSFFCEVSSRWLTLRLMPATSDRLAPSKATGIPSWVPSAEDPPDTKLGCDVDDGKKVDVAKRHQSGIMDVQDAKCFWFAIVLSVKSEASTTYGSGEKIPGGELPAAGGPRKRPPAREDHSTATRLASASITRQRS
jgi:hypothetical protein